jgi:hypothetical protein
MGGFKPRQRVRRPQTDSAIDQKRRELAEFYAKNQRPHRECRLCGAAFTDNGAGLFIRPVVDGKQRVILVGRICGGCATLYRQLNRGR